MSPNFTALFVGAIVFAVSVVAFFWWRFGGANALAFVIVSGVFTGEHAKGRSDIWFEELRQHVPTN